MFISRSGPWGFESLISSKTQKTRQAGFLSFGEARGTFAYALHPPLCTARSGRLEPLAAVMSNGHYVYTLAPFRVRVLDIIKNTKNPTSGFPEFWRGTRDSNPQPTDSKSATLSIELVPQKYIIDYMIIPDVYTCIKGFIDIYLKMAHNKERLSFFWQGM